MKPIAIGDDIWSIHRVPPDDPSLVDRTGTLRIATTDPVTRRINISMLIVPPLLDQVLLHEVTHAITISHGLLVPIRSSIPSDLWVPVEEWSANLMERYAIEAVVLASQSLGRPLCINEYCIMS